MKWKRIELGAANGGRQAEVAATPGNVNKISLPQDPAFRSTDKAAEEIPPLYPEDLADFDEFDFGGAVFGRKSGDAVGEQSVPTGPLNARDLPRHQQSGLRFVEARRLPLRSQPTAPSSQPSPQPANPQITIAPRALPIRKHPARSRRGK